ncbi:MAG: GSCFA domain-containing protein [Saprospiraceae bacterium]|nr:GSCFA domain-containing protein [Saprospiraceae bacterium]
MKLQTPVQLKDPPERFRLNHRFFSMGSCFAEHLANNLIHHHLSLTVNPFGITFNPLSLASQLHRMLNHLPPRKDELFQHDGLYHHWEYHGRFSQANPETALEGMRLAFDEGATRLRSAQQLIITWGSAHYYRFLTDNRIVNNCHKVSNTAFERLRASQQQIMDQWEPILNRILSENPQVQVNLTVSPVRYLRDGLIENNRSKATLLLTAEQLTQTFPGRVYYFPAYELLIDELRDYRFYAEDMTHPTSQSVQYILEKWMQTMLDPIDVPTWELLQKLIRQLDHRPLHPDHPDQERIRQKVHLELDQLLASLSIGTDSPR